MDGKIMEQLRDCLIRKWKQIEKSSVRSEDYSEESGGTQAEIIDIAQGEEQLGRDNA